MAKVVYFSASPILASTLSVKQFGDYIFLQALWDIILFMQFGGADYALPMHASKREEDTSQVFAICTRLALISLPTVWTFSSLLILTLTPAKSLSVVGHAFFLLSLLPVGFSAWQLYILRFGQQNTCFSRGIFALKAAAPTAALIFTAMWPSSSRKLEVFYAALGVSSAVAAMYVLKMRRRTLPLPRVSSDSMYAKRYLYTGLTLIPASFTYKLIWTSDRIISSALFGSTTAGIVGVAALFGSTVLLIRAWLGLLWDPVLVEWSHRENSFQLAEKIQRIFNYASLIFFSVSALGIVWVPSIIRHLYPESLHGAVSLTPWYFIAASFSGLSGVTSATILIAHAPSMYLRVQVFGFLGCISFVSLGMPFIGVHAVAGGIMIAEAIVFLSFLYLGKIKFRNLPLNVWECLKFFVVLMGASLATIPFQEQGYLLELAVTLFIVIFAAIPLNKLRHVSIK